MRFGVTEGSESGHCCFSHSVVDMERPADCKGGGTLIRECFEEADAKLIADLLNAHWGQPNGQAKL